MREERVDDWRLASPTLRNEVGGGQVRGGAALRNRPAGRGVCGGGGPLICVGPSLST